MKKIFSILMIALFGATMLFSQVVLTRGGKVLYDVALEDVDSITFVTDDNGEAMETLSPNAQKDKLVEIAEEMMEMFRPKDQRELIELADYLVYKYGEYDWEPAYEHYEDELPFLRQLARGIRTLVEENVTHNLAMEIYKFPRFTGIFEANDDEETWEYVGESDNIVLRFKNEEGEVCEAVLTGKGEEISVEFEYESDSVATKTWIESPGYTDRILVYVEESINYDYGRYITFYDENGHWISDEYYEEGGVIPAHYEYQWVVTNGYYRNEYYMQPNTAVLPSTITFLLKEGANEHIALEMNFDIEKSKHVNYAMNLKIANLSFVNTTSVNSKEAKVNVDIKCGDKSLLSAKVVAPAVLLLDKTDKEEYEEWFERYLNAFDEYDDVSERLETGFITAEVDLINKLQIKASSKDVVKFYRGLDKIDCYYDEKDGDPEHYWERYYYQYDYNKAVADWYNSNMQVGLYYNTPVKQAELQMDLELDEWTDSYGGYYDENGEYVEEEYVVIKDYDQILVLYFPQNGTTYEFEDYFTEVAFSSVIDLAEDLINSYIKLAKYNEIEPIDFDEW